MKIPSGRSSSLIDRDKTRVIFYQFCLRYAYSVQQIRRPCNHKDIRIVRLLHLMYIETRKNNKSKNKNNKQQPRSSTQILVLD